MKNIVEVKNFKMVFGDKEVISDLSFDVKRGEIFGLLGANGSGKTTTIRALLGFYKATSGELLLDGKKYNQEDTQIDVGYLPEEHRSIRRKRQKRSWQNYSGIILLIWGSGCCSGRECASVNCLPCDGKIFRKIIRRSWFAAG